MNPYLSEKARGEIPRFLKWLRNAGLAFCVFCSFGGLYTLCLDLQAKDTSHVGGYVLWIVVGAVPLASPAGWRATPGRRCPCGGCTTASAWMQRTLHGILKTAISQTSVWTWTKRWSANGPCPATTQNGAEPSQLKQKGVFSWDFLIR